MTTLDDLFEKYLSKDGGIEPSDKAVDRASTAHTNLRADLENDDKYGPYVAKTMLSGSYGRDTSIRHIKDVDVIIQTNFTLQYLQSQKRSDETEQQCMLRLTKEAIKRTGRAAKTREARRSIHVELPADVNDIAGEGVPDLTLDLVPVIIQTDKDSDPMTIADKDLKGWFDTYPNTQLNQSIERNSSSKEIGGRHSYKPLVKIFRAWKQVHYSTKTPKGFMLECLTARFHNPNAEHWIEAVHDLFFNICTEWPKPDNLTYIPTVPDISNSSPNKIEIAKNIEDAQRMLKKIHGHLALVRQAMEEAKSDLTQSAGILQRVFGQEGDQVYFPTPVDLDNGDNGKKGSKKSSPFHSKSDVREAPSFG